MATPTHILVGLGNPGKEYADTRHNIGFMAVDAIAEDCKHSKWKKFETSLITSSHDSTFLLAKPQTFMNLSGEAASNLKRFYKVSTESFIVFHDDLDLQPGQVKIKQGGGSGGHNGLKSLDAHIGPDYWRVRLGIGHPRAVAVATGASATGAEQSRRKTGPGLKGDVVTDYVLGNFAKADKKWLEPLMDALASHLDLLLAGKTAEYLAKLPP